MMMPAQSPYRRKKTRAIGIPTIDLSMERSKLPEEIVRACEELGFFKVINHGVPEDTITRMEKEGVKFFAKPALEKQKAGPPGPFGYGCKNIGYNGDMGELEYLLMESNPDCIAQRSHTISHDDPNAFSCVVNDYIGCVKKLASELLELAAQGLSIPNTTVFSDLITDVNNDSCFRINHYPSPSSLLSSSPCNDKDDENHLTSQGDSDGRIGFGEHSDPQILTILRSNEVGGLQICSSEGFWISVPPDSREFCVLVGDALQALTNGRFVSARHRALALDSEKPRISFMHFAAPSLNACISPIPQTVSPLNPQLYCPFTWGQFKKTLYSLRLGDQCLDLFKCPNVSYSSSKT